MKDRPRRPLIAVKKRYTGLQSKNTGMTVIA